LGISRGALQNRLRNLGLIGAGTSGGIGPSPERDGLAPYAVKGVSTYFNRDGEQAGQWVKTKVEEQIRLKMISDAIEARVQRITPLPEIPLLSMSAESSTLCNVLTITDFHLGMLAWRKEGGNDWDLKIAEQTFKAVFGGVLEGMPHGHTCIINQLGDFLHSDGLVPATPAHGNILDADSRYPKVVDAAMDLIEWIVAKALETHQFVYLLCAEGNHDESGSVWLRASMARIFANNSRVEVERSPLPYYAYKFGDNMFGFHHGHKLKFAELPSLFACDWSKMWGDTTYRYGFTGHYHELHEKDLRGMTMMQHPTVAAADAYSARGGWRSNRRAIGLTYDYYNGEAGRTIRSPEMYGL
jgi:hypothetical protein